MSPRTPDEELSILNLERKKLPGPEHLHDLIRWSRTSVNAIDFWTASGDVDHISYRILNDLTSALARQIREALRAGGQHRKDVIIPVFIPQSPELYISWIAILKAGAAFCPVAVDSPPERFKFILQDVSASLVLTTAENERRIAGTVPDIKILTVSRLDLYSVTRHASSSTIESRSEKTILPPQSLAYVMYTSGSTGLPKGVKISHEAVCQSLLAHEEDIPNFKRFLQFASPTFDVSVFETFFPLFRGATLVSRDRESMLADLPGTIRTMDVDAAELTPTVAGTLLRNRKAAPCLQLLLTIGEMLSKPLIEEFGESVKQPGMLYAMYGPTEASIHCTLAAKVGISTSIHNIGRPLTTVTAMIIETFPEESSAEYTILPKGQVGELAVAGQLASGYLNRAEQTATAFVQLPVYGMFYRTGDRARINDNGDLEMLGRISSGQVKLRGQRVELGEIESVACRVRGVVTAAASIISEVLVLFCVQDGTHATASDIRETCKQHLLNFMMPRDIVLLELESLPRLPSGKMDRKKVESNYMSHKAVGARQDAVAIDQVTAKVCECISEELGIQVSPTTSLWTEGLNSLMAIKIASSLHAQEIQIGVLDLLELETVAKIATKLNARYRESGGPCHSTDVLIEDTDAWQDVQKAVEATIGDVVDTNHVEYILPCNAIQVAMLAETVSSAKLNFNSIKLKASPSITLHDVCSAFEHLAQKNDILRSGFVPVDHSSIPFVQVIWHKLDLDHGLSLLHPLSITSTEDSSSTFMFQIHHSVYDGWSWDLIMADLNKLLTKREILERPQFRYVNREQRRLQSSQRKAAEQYWRDTLATASLSCLPQLNPQLGITSEHGVEREMLQTSSSDLTAFTQRLHISSQTVLSTAVSLLLSAYTGSSDVIFGLVSSGRHLPVQGIDRVIGPCLSTLPLKVDLSTVQTVQDILLYVNGLQLKHLENGMSLRDVLTAGAISSRQRLFDTLFIWQESLTTGTRNDEIIEVVETRDCLDYPLIIEAEPENGRIIVKLSYDVAIVSPDHARNLLVQLDSLVTAILADPGRSLINIWHTCTSKVLAIANANPLTFDTSFDLTSTIQDLAQRQPERVAVSFTLDFDPHSGSIDNEAITYAELWVQSTRMAQVIQSMGVGVDDIVCVLVDKSLDLYVLNLAIVLAGGAFLNIDNRTPLERISRILKNDNQLSVPLSSIKAGASKFRGQDSYRPVDVNGSHLAYAVMTSGTTGVPKAILVTRGNLLSNIDILSRTYPRYDDRGILLQACSPAFDVFVFELFWTLHMGMCLCSGTNDVLFRDIEGFIRAAKVSHLSLTPSVAALIQPDNVPMVEFLVTAGEPMSSKVFTDWAGRGLFQGYGPAETTNICNIKGPVRKSDLINNVGPPFRNTSIFICGKRKGGTSDSEIQILPIGAVGEIVIGGDQVARGYADEDLSARSFITNKYGRLYRSGDMGRLLANGDLIILGRDDDQIKLRGQRIELGDVNTALTKPAFVEDAVTIIAEDNDGHAKLVSFWVGNTESEPQNTCSRLYEFLKASLPQYMIPENLVPINAMPLTRQGKVDKNALVQRLRDLDAADLQRFSRGAAEPELEENFTDEERIIAEILSEVTETQLVNIKPSTSFYSLGIDSISSVRLSHKLRQANIGKVDVSMILKHYSVRRLRKALSEVGQVSKISLDRTRLHEIFPVKWRSQVLKRAEAEGHLVEKIMACTALQESILMSQANTQGSMSYRVRMEFEIPGDVNRLYGAWSRLVKRHQILRTGFTITPFADHAYAQVVFENVELPYFTSGDRISTQPLKPEVSINPPWHIFVNKAHTKKQSSLILVMSHALYDSEALTLLLREVELMYKEQLLPPIVSPDEYTRYVSNLSLGEIDDFWRSRMEGYEPKSFAKIFQPECARNEMQSTHTRISNFSVQSLQGAARQYSATSSTLLQAAWARLLSCYINVEDITFGNVFSGRNLPIEGITNIIAPLFNTLPLRIQVTGRQSMLDLVAATQKSVLEVLPFQPSPLRRIVRNQKLDGRPLFDTLVLIQSGSLKLDESIWILREEEGHMDFAGVIVEIVPDATTNRLTFKLHVQSEEIDSSAAEHILSNYDVLLGEVLQYPQAQSGNFASIASSLPHIHMKIVTALKTRTSELSHLVHDDDQETLTDLEFSIRTLFALFSAVDVAKIQRSTSIFELGLDSLHVVQIASEMRGIGHNITGADVLEARTIDKLSQFCIMRARQGHPYSDRTFDLQAFDQKHRQGVCEQLGLLSKDVWAIRPSTSTQSGILTEFINSRGKLYFNSITLELSRDADLSLFKKSWQTVMDRNEMLRTGFVTLSTSEHTYAMVTYKKGVHEMPWLVEGDFNEAKTKNLAKLCLQTIHHPCWRLSLRRHAGAVRLELYLLHALYDAKSLDGIVSEVTAIYQDQATSLPDTIPVAPALRAILDQSEGSRQTSGFWTKLAAGATPCKFPNLNIRQSAEGDNVTVKTLSDSMLPELQNGCRRLGVTLQSVCQIAWARLLAAYTGESKVTFGVVLSGRTLHEITGVLFPTINTVPFSLEVRRNMSEMLRETTVVNVGLYKHQFTPATVIRRHFQIEGELFDTIFALQTAQPVPEDKRPWKVIDDRASSEYAISLEVVPHKNDTVELRITTRSDVVPAEHAALILQQYEILLREIVYEGSVPHSMSQDLQAVIAAKEVELPTKIKLLHDLFDATVTKSPSAIALEFAYSIANRIVDKRCWNYRQLSDESNKIANLLLASGAKVGDFVAVCFEKCPEASFAILGVLKAGCAYVAIDPSAPAARKRFIFDDARCKIMLTTKSLVFRLESDSKFNMLAVDERRLIQSYPKTNPVLDRIVQPSDVCYCLYTSGTTGQPKGCLITHASAVQAMLSFQQIFAGYWDRDSRWLQFASFHFDVSVLEQFWSWSVGICVTSAPRDVLFEDLPGAIDALRITHLDLTPSLARLIRPEQVPTLCRGVFVVGGEQVTQDIIDIWGPHGCLYNFYGPSEVTIGCTVHRRVKKGVKATNIGEAWDNVGAFVLEPGSERPVLRGAAGELCLSGPLVGKGYLNRPELTAEKFVTLKQYGIRVYRSGDLVRLLHDDSFEFLGRIDDQVKLRGQRLEIREIDYGIKQASESVVDVATMVMKHSDQPSEQLVAFFTIRGQVMKSAKLTIQVSSSAESIVSQIRRHLQDVLPAYMVPTHFLPVSHIPLSANNKADLKALKSLFTNMPVRSLQNMDWNGERIAPTTETTRRIIGLLATFLNVPETAISPSSRLFELGLDSISAVGLASLLRKEGFSNADAATIMQKPVIAQLAHKLDSSEGDDYKYAVEMANLDINRFRQANEQDMSSLAAVQSFWPCTPLQEDMLLKTIHRGDIPFYLSTFHYALDSSVSSDVVKHAWAHVQRKFPILRTTFTKTSSKQYAQVVRQSCATSVSHQKLALDEDIMAVLTQIASDWSSKVDVLSDEPSWGVELIEVTSGQLYMSLRIFHGLYDANSLSIMLKEVANLMRNGTNTLTEHDLPFHQALPYGPLCQREGARAFWEARFSNPVLLNLSPRYSVSKRTSASWSVEHALPECFVVTKNNLAVTEWAIFQAAYLLTMYSTYDIFPTFGVVVSGRSFPMTGVEELCGPLLNTLPAQLLPKAHWSRADLIKACHNLNVELKPFEHTSLREIRKWVGIDSGKALFDTLFVFQKQGRNTTNKHEDLWQEIGQTTTPDYPLNLEVELKSNVFKLTIVADPEFLSKKDLFCLSLKFLNCFEQLVRKPEDLLLHNEGCTVVGPQERPAETTWQQESIDNHILQQVKSQVALLAQQDVEDLTDDMSLFSLGLDSITLIKLSGALRKCGLPVSVNVIMRLSTPTGIAQYLTERQDRLATTSCSKDEGQKFMEKAQTELTSALRKQSISFNHIETIWPVTAMQENVLANFETYYHFALLKLSADTDAVRLHLAWSSAIKLHCVLRTRFVAVDDPVTKHVFAQLISASQNIHWETEYVEHESQLRDLIAQEKKRVTKASLSYPSIMLKFVTNADLNDRYILLGMSHAIYDGWSIELLHQDILTFYNGHQVERPPVEPYLERIINHPREGARTFWTEQSSNYIPRSFPPLSIDQGKITTSYKTTAQSRMKTSLIRKFCMDNSVTFQTLGLTVWTSVLSSYLQKRDICFGVVLACRDMEDTDQLMFPTFNTVPFRPRFAGGSHLDLLKHIQQLSLEIAEHQNFPLKDIKKLSSSSSGNSIELFDTLFVLQKRPDLDEALPKLYEEVDMGEEPSLEYPLNVEMDIGETTTWTAAASGSVLDQEGVNDLVAKLDETLEALLQCPTAAAISIDEAESLSEEMNTQPSRTPVAESGRYPGEGAILQDDTLRNTIFNTIASVAHCRLDSLSGDTNIYSIGLDSISMIKVTGLLRKENIALPVGKIIAAVTLDRIVNEARCLTQPEHLIASRRSSPSHEPIIAEGIHKYLAAHGIAKTAIEAIAPASAGQTFMLDFYQASGRRLFYPAFRYRLRGAMISEDQIYRAWDMVMKAFPALRTRFVEIDEETWQVIIKPDAVAHYPPAARLTLAKEPAGMVIELRLHHALYDAVSLPIITSAFEKACQGQELRFEANGSISRSFLEATRGDTTSAAARRDFWTNYLADAPSERLCGSGTFEARRVEVVQENAITDSMSLVSRAATAGVSVQALFLAVCGRVYATFLSSRQNRVVLGVYLANRGLDIEGLGDLAAPTLNIVPLVVNVEASLFESAEVVQRDLANLQRAEYCGATLREIYGWTGVRIDCFVNFVPRVEADGVQDDDDMYGDGGGIELVPYPHESREDAAGWDQELVSPFLGAEPGEQRSSCVPSVDVEAKLEVGGGLTMGVFTPEDKLGEDGAGRMVREIKELLGSLGG